MVSEFVRENLGAHFAENPPSSLDAVYPSTRAGMPVIFVLSVGADPTGELLSLAQKREMGDRLTVVALGQGQGPRAEQAIISVR